ncbi:MAG: hypothetical protein L0322_29165, partial [Chloroflexi bacterium]|nr:hypothetical protein [Chloroflexota bacterium]
PPTAGPTATPTATPLPNLELVQEPLLIDDQAGRLYALGRVDGITKTVALATGDGRLLAAFDPVGLLALDPAHGRLFVDQGAAGVAVLDALTGERLGTVTLPIVGPAPAAPQVDPLTGLAYAFRGKNIYTIDPDGWTVSHTQTLSIERSVCGDPGGEALIERSYYDQAAARLYLSFITYVCTPWVSQSLVAYEVPSLAELGRYSTELRYQTIPFQGNLYGLTTSRLGPSIFWAWDGRAVWYEVNSGETNLIPQGAAADGRRSLLYEAVSGQIRVVAAETRELLHRVDVVVLAEGGRLAGYDPATDQLYFLFDGQLVIRPLLEIIPGLESPAES